MNDRPKIVVVGAGVAGLAVAFELIERAERLPGGIDLVCLEAAPRAGGTVRSERDHGYLCEWGPHGMRDNAAATTTLIRRLGLTDRVVTQPPHINQRFIYRAGRLRAVPSRPGDLLRSGLLPPASAIRVLLEPFVPCRKELDDESVHGFVARRFGHGAASILADALVSGVYAGDARSVSMRSAFVHAIDLERKYGSLLRAMGAMRKRGGGGGGVTRPRIRSFRNGMQELTDALVRQVGDRVRTGLAVSSIGSMGSRGFRVFPAEGPPLDVDAVIVAVPAWSAARMLRDADRELGMLLDNIPYVPMVLVHSGFSAGALRPLPGSGFLAPRNQGLRSLGSLWSSNLFEGRAPAGMALLTTMLGGRHDPEVIDLSDDELVEIVRRDLALAMGVQAPSAFTRVHRHAAAMPQYDVGHEARMERVVQALARHPGLRLAGNAYRGVSVNHCIEQAPAIAESVLEYLLARPVRR